MNYRTITNLQDIKEYLNNVPLLAFDFETAPDESYRSEDKAALDAHKSHIAGISFSVSEGDAIYVPLTHITCENLEHQDELWAYLKNEIFKNKGVIKVAHNLSFEAMFLYARGIVIQSPCYDTIAAAQLILKNNTEFRKLSDSGLKTLATKLFDVEMPTFDTVTAGRPFDELDPQDFETIRYACSDSDHTLRLYLMFNDWFARFMPKHRYITEKLESPAAIYCGIMKYNGVPMDVKAMYQKQTEAAEKLAELREQIAFIIGDVNIGENAGTAAFRNYLFHDLGLPVLRTTAKSKEAADDVTMILLTDWCRENRPDLVHLFELIQEYRKWGKLRSTYIEGYLKFINTATGRIHPELMPLGTETGRFAARNPNLQNCPRKDNDPVGIRNFITAPEGNVILSLDFSQIELRVGAFYCRDEKMLETYGNGGDIHAQTTSVIYNISLNEALDKSNHDYKERRTIAKNVNFGTFYGLFPNGLHNTLKFKAGLDTPVEECERIIENIKTGYPGLARWQAKVKANAARYRYTETWLGRRRYLPYIASSDWGKRSFAERCAMNTPIQGTAADILKLACGRITAGLSERPWLKPLLQIHDELVFELPSDRVDEAVVFIKSCMNMQPFPDFDVPIIAEAAYGPSFGQLKEME